ncbi:hypothetical protein DIPPA_33062 [Diplonema papillatum]|nr:hypothetical protein DIPPA_33062 [Diplonema papillatum]
MSAASVGLVIELLEENGRMEVKWSEQLARADVRNHYEPKHLANAKKLKSANGTLSSVQGKKELSFIMPRTNALSAVGRGRVCPSSYAGSAVDGYVDPHESSALQEALDLAAKENAKLKLTISVMNQERSELEQVEYDVLSDVFVDDATPGELAWKRATALHHLPRTISEESMTEETFDWRRTLEMREKAVLHREKLVTEREIKVRDLESRQADLEQARKEIAIKDREYKLRFRGVEERETKEGNMPKMLKELEEREQACLEKETALEERDEAMNDRETALNDRSNDLDAREATLQEREEAVVGREPPPPHSLLVEIPKQPKLSGVYNLSLDSHRGRPKWESDDATRALYHEGGKWVFGFVNEMDEGIVWVTSARPHKGDFPDAISEWMTYEDETDFVLDEEVTVVTN